MAKDLTLKQVYVGQIMMGMVSRHGYGMDKATLDGVVTSCYKYADALIAYEEANGKKSDNPTA